MCPFMQRVKSRAKTNVLKQKIRKDNVRDAGINETASVQGFLQNAIRFFEKPFFLKLT